MSLLRCAAQRALPLLTVLLLSFATHAGGTHSQSRTVDGRTYAIQFDHDGDNPWWVEALVRGAGGDSAVTVEARVEGGAWHHLKHMGMVGDWHKWGTDYPHGQFEVPSGKRVQFRASVMDGASGTTASVESCLFTHPAGVEQCSVPFDVFFGLVKGNEWWVQTDATSTGGTIARIDVRLNAGDWKPLQKQSWQNGWAASYHIVDGTVVQLRATSTAGATDLSNCFKWIPPQTGGQNAQEIPCASSAFDAKFAGVQGNEWWVQATVTGNQPIAKVQARDSPGPWRDLAKQSWQNGWAASFQVPEGEKVQLRAQSTAGQWDYSANGWEWPYAFAYPGTHLGTDYDAIFEEVSKDPGWVQVNVYADEGTYGLARVDVRVDGGAWTPLTRQSWGDWAKAMTPGPGADVQFRAVAKSGHVAESGVHSWPGAMAPEAWPQAGSFVAYDLHSHQSSGQFRSETDAVMRLTYDGSQWNAVCTGTTVEMGDGETTTTEWTYSTVQGPRQMSPTLAIGTTTNTKPIFVPSWGGSCELTEWVVQVEGEGWHTTGLMRSDDPYVLRALAGDETADDETSQSLSIHWEKRLGMVLDWRRAGHMSGVTFYEGRLVDTDAPIT